MALRTVAIVQARMGSSRLPGKVLKDIGGQPMLQRVLERVQRAKLVQHTLVATTTDPLDDAVADFCQNNGYAFFRGNMFDVLDRYYQSASSVLADVVVRVTADCPLIDPDLIDRTISAFGGQVAPEDKIISQRNPSLGLAPPAKGFDFATNRLPPPFGRTYPIGLDVEVCSFSALEYAWDTADQAFQREHVMPYFYEKQDRFSALLINHTEDLGALRWTVDTAEDLDFVRQVYRRFDNRDAFSWLDVLALVRRQPELAEINAHVAHKSVQDVDKRALKEKQG